MLVRNVTKKRQKKARYIKSQLVLRGIKVRDIATQAECTPELVRMVISGVRANEKVKLAISEALKKPYEVLWQEKTYRKAA